MATVSNWNKDYTSAQSSTPKYGYGTDVEYGKAVGYTDKNQEIQRTQDVIKNRQQAGMDITNQTAWYKNLTGNDWNGGQTQNQYMNNFNSSYTASPGANYDAGGRVQDYKNFNQNYLANADTNNMSAIERAYYNYGDKGWGVGIKNLSGLDVMNMSKEFANGDQGTFQGMWNSIGSKVTDQIASNYYGETKNPDYFQYRDELFDYYSGENGYQTTDGMLIDPKTGQPVRVNYNPYIDQSDIAQWATIDYGNNPLIHDGWDLLNDVSTGGLNQNQLGVLKGSFGDDYANVLQKMNPTGYNPYAVADEYLPYLTETTKKVMSSASEKTTSAKDNTGDKSKTPTAKEPSTTINTANQEDKTRETLQRYLNGMWGGGY